MNPFSDELFPEAFLPIRITGSSGLELIAAIAERRKYEVLMQNKGALSLSILVTHER